jgi:hypothetical protein
MARRIPNYALDCDKCPAYMKLGEHINGQDHLRLENHLNQGELFREKLGITEERVKTLFAYYEKLEGLVGNLSVKIDKGNENINKKIDRWNGAVMISVFGVGIAMTTSNYLLK